MKPIKHKRGRPLRSRRSEMGLTLADLALKVASDPEGGQISKFERGERWLPFDLAARVADVCGIPLEKLLSPEQLKTFGKIRQLVDRDAAA